MKSLLWKIYLLLIPTKKINVQRPLLHSLWTMLPACVSYHKSERKDSWGKYVCLTNKKLSLTLFQKVIQIYNRIYFLVMWQPYSWQTYMQILCWRCTLSLRRKLSTFGFFNLRKIGQGLSIDKEALLSTFAFFFIYIKLVYLQKIGCFSFSNLLTEKIPDSRYDYLHYHFSFFFYINCIINRFYVHLYSELLK